MADWLIALSDKKEETRWWRGHRACRHKVVCQLESAETVDLKVVIGNIKTNK